MAPFFELRNVSKCFARVVANKDVSFSIDRGEVLALLGENGAGKSTVMKILYGLYRADSGHILMDGVEKHIHSPRDAMALGVSMIQQHFALVNAHTVTENIILGNIHGKIDYKACREKVLEISRQYGFELPADEKVGDLAVGVQQKVEIVKALYLKTRLLIMDEPTAVLTPQETDKLMQFVIDFTRAGNSVIFITHKLKEVMEIADNIVVMRSGMVAGNVCKKDTNERELSQLMIGKELVKAERTQQAAISGDIRLELRDVLVQHKNQVPVLKDVSLQIARGEIFGIAGVSGNGQEELCRVVCGALPVTKGSLWLNGVDITQKTVRERIEMGIGYVPVDRYRDAMVMDMTLAENMMLKTNFQRKWKKGFFINEKLLNDETNAAIRDFNIKAPGPDAKAGELSGGNQQKVVLAREVASGTQLLVMDQPTRGLDLGAVNNIHATILEESRKGKSILLISTELSEIFALCDRIAVIFKGAFMGIYSREELTTEKIGLLMAGYSDNQKEAAI